MLYDEDKEETRENHKPNPIKNLALANKFRQHTP
jgi:hypothetical protein